ARPDRQAPGIGEILERQPRLLNGTQLLERLTLLPRQELRPVPTAATDAVFQRMLERALRGIRDRREAVVGIGFPEPIGCDRREIAQALLGGLAPDPLPRQENRQNAEAEGDG